MASAGQGGYCISKTRGENTKCNKKYTDKTYLQSHRVTTAFNHRYSWEKGREG